MRFPRVPKQDPFMAVLQLVQHNSGYWTLAASSLALVTFLCAAWCKTKRTKGSQKDVMTYGGPQIDGGTVSNTLTCLFVWGSTKKGSILLPDMPDTLSASLSLWVHGLFTV